MMAITAAIALAACRRQPPAWESDPMALAPAQAGFFVGVKVAQVYESPAYAVHRAQLESGPTARALQAAATCRLRPQDVQFAGLAVDATRNYVLILRGAGLGELERWRCLAEHSQQAIPGGFSPPFRLDSESSPPRLLGVNATSQASSTTGVDSTIGAGNATSDGRVGWIVDDSTVVLTTTAWQDAVASLIHNRGLGGASTTEQQLLTAAQRDHSVWFVGKFPPVLPTAAGLLQLGGSIAVGDALHLQAWGHFVNEDQAQAALTELRGKITAFGGLAPVFGVPASVVSAISLTRDGKSVALSVPVGRDALVAMQHSLSQISRGPEEAPPLPAPTLGLSGDLRPEGQTTP